MTRELVKAPPDLSVPERPWRRHLPFLLLFAPAAAVRVVAMIAYDGILWFPDGHSYLTVAVHPVPYPVRPMGYSMFLRLLEPFHSLAFIAAVQHAMGLAAGVIIYAVLRRFRTPGWVATLCAVPVLFDAYQLQLEHLLLSDTLFWFLVLVAVALVVCRPDAWPAMAGAGLVLGAAAVTRSVGLPLLAVFVAYLLVRRRPRAALGVAAACLTPVAAYAIWFHATWGTYALTNGNGIFMYARTTTFADCRVIAPPDRERALCPAGPVGTRLPAPDYVWHAGPLGDIPNYQRFTPAKNAWTQDYVRRAITAQPVAYVNTGIGDLVKTFAPTRVVYPRRSDLNWYRFPARVKPQKLHSFPLPKRTLGGALRRYTADPHADGVARMDPGAAAFLRGYQSVVRVPGPVLGLILIGGAAGVVVRRRGVYWGARQDGGGASFGRLYGASGYSQGSKRKNGGAGSRGASGFGQGSKRKNGGAGSRGASGFGQGAKPENGGAGSPGAGLPWLCAVALLVVPPFTVAFDHRYVIPAVPLACLALGLALRRSGGGTGTRSGAEAG